VVRYSCETVLLKVLLISACLYCLLGPQRLERCLGIGLLISQSLLTLVSVSGSTTQDANGTFATFSVALDDGLSRHRVWIYMARHVKRKQESVGV